MTCFKQLLIAGVLSLSAAISQAAGLLTPVNSSLGSLEIREHHVQVAINHGYVTTAVEQIFFNPNPQELEAIYSFPVPDKAAVGEFTYWIDGKPIIGEVVEKQQAKAIYEQEKQAGREAALVEKDSHKTFDISVTPVRANGEVKIRLVYVQAAHIDSSVGRYVYPLEEGGVDEYKNAFWSRNEAVTEKFSFTLQLNSAYPVDALRLPQHPAATINKMDANIWQVQLTNTANAPSASAEEQGVVQHSQGQRSMQAAQLNQDIVLYWRLAEGLPGSMDMLTYRDANQSQGTFMLTLTPGDDLNPIQQGRDWIFVLDVSGSMQGKYSSLVEGVRQGLGKLKPQDRFKVVLFNNKANDFTQGFISVDQTNVEQVLNQLQQYQPNGGTNLYAGMTKGLHGLDADRSNALILVTDGVANVGLTEKKDFIKLLKQYDVRLFTFIMGNSANRPLLSEMTGVSKGFAQSISNADDISGQILLASQKLTHEALRNIDISIDGTRTTDLSAKTWNSLYRGEQLIVFGHYHQAGKINVTIKGTAGAQTKKYSAEFDLPEVDTLNPELERLWAYATIEHLAKQMEYYGANADTKQAITDLATQYGLVTDYTSMLVVREEVLQQLGIQPNNKDRVLREQQARQQRQQKPAAIQASQQRQVVSQQPRATTSGGGGGGSSSLLMALGMLMLIIMRGMSSRRLNLHSKNPI